MEENNGAHHALHFGDFTLDIDRGALMRNGSDIKLRPKSFEVLRYLVTRHGVLVSRDELLDEVWGETVVTEDAVTQCLKDIRRAIGDKKQTMIRTVPRRGYIFELPVSEAVQSDGPPGSPVKAAAPSRHYGWPVGAALGLIVLFLLWWQPTESPAEDPGVKVPDFGSMQHSVAVLPFDDLSAAQDQTFFADGISEEILNQLARSLSLKVIARDSSFSYRDGSVSLATLGNQLGVTHIIKGSVQKHGAAIRINVQLVDVASGEYIWRDSFDRELSASGIFNVQSEIATRVARSLDANLSPRDAIPTRNLEALEAYFRGRQRMETRRPRELDLAEQYFQRAVELDPQFALAYAAMAETHRLQSNYGTLSRRDAAVKIEGAVAKALQINDQLGEAYAALANLQRWRLDYTGAAVSFKHGIELAPHYAPLYQWYGEFLASDLNDPDAGVPYAHAAVVLDPLSPIKLRDYGKALAQAGRYEAALEQYDKAIEIDPEFAPAYHSKAWRFRSSLGRVADAIELYEKAAALNPGTPRYPASIGWAWLELGDVRESEKWLQSVRAIAPDHASSVQLSFAINLYQGNIESATADAERLLAMFASPGRVSHPLRFLRDRDVARSDFAEAISRYRYYHPGFFADEPPLVYASNFPPAIDLAWLLKQAGDYQRAENLLEGAIQLFNPDRRLASFQGQIADVKIHAIRGDIRAALDALRSAIDAGWCQHWWLHLKHDRALDNIRDHPEFQALVERLEAKMADQRKQLISEQLIKITNDSGVRSPRSELSTTR